MKSLLPLILSTLMLLFSLFSISVAAGKSTAALIMAIVAALIFSVLFGLVLRQSWRMLIKKK